MKVFFRKLSIEGRKGFINSIIYTIFSFLHILLTKTILYNSKISPITIIFISGSLLVMMSFYRIFRLMKKFESNKNENIKINFIVGFNLFLSYFCIISSVNTTSLTNIIFIFRLYSFLLMINKIIKNKKNISSHQLASFIMYFICFLFIFFPALYHDPGYGALFCLISFIFKFSSYKYLSQAKSINVDLLMLNIGFYSSFFGGAIIITTFDQIEFIGRFMWILIILNAFVTYFMKIFLHKILKGDTNERILIILNVIFLIFTLPIDFFLFGEIFYYNYLLLLFSFVEIYFFYKEVKKVIKSDDT